MSKKTTKLPAETEAKRKPGRHPVPTNPVTGCTDQEAIAIQAIVMGMSREQASKKAGYAHLQSLSVVLQRPRCKAYMERLYIEAQEKFKITRADVVAGLKDAIDDAKLLSDPTAQISGWREIGKMLGYYAPEEKKITLTTDQETLRSTLESLPDEELLRLTSSGSLDVLEGDFEVLDDE